MAKSKKMLEFSYDLSDNFMYTDELVGEEVEGVMDKYVELMRAKVAELGMPPDAFEIDTVTVDVTLRGTERQLVELLAVEAAYWDGGVSFSEEDALDAIRAGATPLKRAA